VPRSSESRERLERPFMKRYDSQRARATTLEEAAMLNPGAQTLERSSDPDSLTCSREVAV
jgi:hypothetical protein